MYVAGVGNCHCVLSVQVGKDVKGAKPNVEMSRRHMPVQGGLREEELRITKAGFIMRDDMLCHLPADDKDFHNEINVGSPITRCLGDLRYKCNPALPPLKQSVICMPDIRVCASWKAHDYLVVGSSGYWNLIRNSSLTSINSLKQIRSQRVKKFLLDEPEDKKVQEEYVRSETLVKETL